MSSESHGFTTEYDPSATLSEADIEALDELVEARFDLSAVPPPLRPRARRISRLLALLRVRSASDPRLIESTVAAVTADSAAEAVLTGDDAEALDAWVTSGFAVERVAVSLRDRACAQDALARLVTSGPAPSAADRRDLLDRTLTAVQADIESVESRLAVASYPTRSLRLADVVSVAAVLLLTASVVWPVLSTVRAQSQKTFCSANLQQASMALGGYAGMNRDSLPVINAGFGGGTWWNVGEGPARSNSANLYTLTREHYVDLEKLACPGNPRSPTVPHSPDAEDWRSLDELSYSYRVMAGAGPAAWNTPVRIVVVTDRSPVVPRAVRGEPIIPWENSPNHRGRGQYVLFNDGAAEWHNSSELPNGDNVWLPRPVERLIDALSGRRRIDPIRGTEAPEAPEDAFVGP